MGQNSLYNYFSTNGLFWREEMESKASITTENTTWKAILKLALPAVIEQFLQTVVNYVDTAMVGSIGVHASAAIGLTTPVIFMVFGVMYSMGIGFSVLVSHNIGSGNLEHAKNIIRHGLITALVAGGLISLFAVLVLAPKLPLWMGAANDVGSSATIYMRIFGSAYIFNMLTMVSSAILRASGDTKTPLIYNTITNVINVVFNFFLIYPSRNLNILGLTVFMPGAGLGIAGAAIATAISIAFTGISLTIVLFIKRSPIRLDKSSKIVPDISIVRSAFKLSLPVFFERVTISAGQVVTTALITSLGTISLAAHQIAGTGESLCYMPASGFAMAAASLTGRCLGAGREDLAFSSGRLALRMAVLTLIFNSFLMYTFSYNITDFFSNDESAIELGAKMLRVEVLAEPFLAIGIVSGGIFQGGGDVKRTLMISIIGVWAVRVPSSYIMLKFFDMGLLSVWYAMILDWFTRALLSLWRFYSKKWMHHLSS